MCVHPGNAAITLRSRLKVKVVKAAVQQPHEEEEEGEEEGGQQQAGGEEQGEEHNGFLCPHGPPGGDAGKVTLQLQVRPRSRGLYFGQIYK